MQDNEGNRREYIFVRSPPDREKTTLVIIDEIPEVPELLNEVHRLISERNLIFILCGSSARKLSAYIDVYLKEEIKEEALAQKIQKIRIP